MRWQEICNCIFYVFLATTASGSVFTVLWLIGKKCLGNAHTRLLDISLRICIQAYWFPAVVFAVLFGYNRKHLYSVKDEPVTIEIFKLSPLMEKMISVLIIAWMSAIIATIIYWIVREMQMKHMLAGSVPEDDAEVLACYGRMKRRLGIRSDIPLMRNDLFEIPFTVGIFRRKVVLPFYQYSEKELEVIFAHELTHCKHHDLFFKMESIFLNVLHAVNPLAYLVRHYVTEYTEMDCDICACRAAGELFSTQEYYKVVLALSTDRKEPMVLLSAFYVKTAALERRLCAMISYQERKRKSKVFAATVIWGYILGGSLVSFGISRQFLVLQKYYFEETRLLRAEGEKAVVEHVIPAEAVCDDNLVVMIRLDSAISHTFCNIAWDVPAGAKYATTDFRITDVRYITITMKIPEDGMVRVGLRYPDGTEHYVGKEVSLNYTFSDLTDGEEYSFFVENLGNSEVNVEGGFICFND